mgnify:CR=1 FL=1
MNKLKETKILGFPLWMYLIFSILMMVMAANDWMLTNMVGALAFAMIIGTLLGWVGDHIPVRRRHALLLPRSRRDEHLPPDR